MLLAAAELQVSTLLIHRHQAIHTNVEIVWVLILKGTHHLMVLSTHLHAGVCHENSRQPLTGVLPSHSKHCWLGTRVKWHSIRHKGTSEVQFGLSITLTGMAIF